MNCPKPKPQANRFFRRNPIISWLAGAMALFGCSTVDIYPYETTIVGVPMDSTKLKDRNATATDWYKKNEWVFNAESGNRPKLCLALSGGGLRSASFAIGVMAALEQAGLMEKIDVISAVSGGAYAASWYYAQHLIHDAELRSGHMSRKALFAWRSDGSGAPRDTVWSASLPTGIQDKIEDSKTQQNQREPGPIIITEAEGIFGGLFNIISSPLNLAANGLFGAHWNTSPVLGFYED
ncbi:MAG: hypothetical protein FJX46_12575 [Alphaproteobacteria bacterium]|nr:hypothetical protein [Alphaproteobacteria bacterium]